MHIKDISIKSAKVIILGISSIAILMAIIWKIASHESAANIEIKQGAITEQEGRWSLIGEGQGERSIEQEAIGGDEQAYLLKKQYGGGVWPGADAERALVGPTTRGGQWGEWVAPAAQSDAFLQVCYGGPYSLATYAAVYPMERAQASEGLAHEPWSASQTSLSAALADSAAGDPLHLHMEPWFLSEAASNRSWPASAWPGEWVRSGHQS